MCIKDCKPFPQLLGVEAEVKMIRQILKTSSLSQERTLQKDQVLSRLKAVSLVHIAAHGRSEPVKLFYLLILPVQKDPKKTTFFCEWHVLDAQLHAKLVD